MLRGRSIVLALALLGAMSICAAQDTADIIVGGQAVARVREAGTYESVQHRAAAVDERINELLATTDDPGSLEVSLEQVDGRWTVMIAGKPIVAVYPAEAEANGMTPEMLGATWVRKFKDALPGATAAPVTVIGEPAAEGTEAAPTTTTPTPPTQPIMIADEPVLSSPTAGDETVAPSTTTTATPPTTATADTTTSSTVEILEVPQEDTNEPEEIVAGQGARLLILEAFNKSRDLPEDDYLVRRETMANDLFDNLMQMLTGGRATGRIETTGAVSLPTPPRPPVTTTTTPPETASTGATGATATTTTAQPPATHTIDTGPIETGATPAATTTTGAAPSLAISAAGLEKIEAHIPANDASYANVVKKVAIKAKFRAASAALRTADPQTKAQAMEVLTAARRANTGQDWDAAEQHLDTGLRILGVTQWEQHIDAAMRDLGLVK